MNFFDATLAGSDNDLAVETKAFRLLVPPELLPALKPHLGQEIVMGLRPEDIYVASEVPAGISGEKVQCKLDLQELMGNEIFLHLTDNGDDFTARVTPRAVVTPGEMVDIVLDTHRMHIFDRQTEMSLIPREMRDIAAS